MGKDPATLSDEEKAFVKDHQDELTDEQKTALADTLKDEKPAADTLPIETPSDNTPPADRPIS